ncbi:spliceosome-associated protein CWC27 homolog [Ornithodoros turicata]|uniref:spliceosome-associated protein CWC27 homolog n=1 Tax=Ornithodoros turicata TaxID=34597 RepID=UPI0031395A47
MSNIYIQEPPTHGKVLLKTTVGDIDVELWSKETPKACRNFVQLCMEGYYDGTIFHRVVKGFIAQGGDPTGTGEGGESIYGAPFKDEFHTRLRFVRRGLVAMASGGKDDNSSQFFFTLGACPDLQNKHTVFGKVAGDTLYNMLKLEEGIVDPNERPLHPHKIISAEVLANPFEDIVPRQTKKKSREEGGKKEKVSKPGTKNFKLLSFGEEAEEEEAEVDAVVKPRRGQSKSSHDLTDDPQLSSVPVVEAKRKADSEGEDDEDREEKKDPAMVERIHKRLKKDQPKVSPEPEERNFFNDERKKASDKKIGEIRKEFKQLLKDMKSEDEARKKAKEGNAEEVKEESEEETDNSLLAELKAERKKYAARRQGLKGSEREQQTLALLEKFQNKMQSVQEKHTEKGEDKSEEEGSDTEDWLAHELHFEEQGPKVAKDANIRSEEAFELSDPRNPINERRRKKPREHREHRRDSSHREHRSRRDSRR